MIHFGRFSHVYWPVVAHGKQRDLHLAAGHERASATKWKKTLLKTQHSPGQHGSHANATPPEFAAHQRTATPELNTSRRWKGHGWLNMLEMNPVRTAVKMLHTSTTKKDPQGQKNSFTLHAGWISKWSGRFMGSSPWGKEVFVNDHPTDKKTQYCIQLGKHQLLAMSSI